MVIINTIHYTDGIIPMERRLKEQLVHQSPRANCFAKYCFSCWTAQVLLIDSSIHQLLQHNDQNIKHEWFTTYAGSKLQLKQEKQATKYFLFY